MKNNLKALFEIHFAVFLFGLSGLIGKMISLPPMLIVFGRTFFAVMTLALILKLGGNLFIKIQRNHFLLIFLTGIILAFHWFCFFYSIHISSVAIGLLTFSSFPLFVTFMEPLDNTVMVSRDQYEALLRAVTGGEDDVVVLSKKAYDELALAAAQADIGLTRREREILR